MQNLFLEQEMESIIMKADAMDQKTLKAYMQMIGKPKTVEEFLKSLQQAIEKGTSQQMIYLKIIEKIRSKALFPFVMDIVKNITNPIQVQTIFKSTVALPDEADRVEEYIPVILDAIKRNVDTEVIYHGVCLIYRTIKKYPQLEEIVQQNKLILEYKELEKIIKKFDILEKWETEGHRGKSKPGYLLKQEDFVNFTLQFIKFQ
ncbi:hypothetical protein CACET_c34020 [Clostridium aceticum]|uniref:Uncharacterized protein n=1 Tax=Clostridium aceticum TaxID=84022 RepID=A0A0D8IBW7_9CLOT|nr:hypothetical protein [Clostridium aceticum]AKL96845.1 hypothetical protein CACET_c34020 [Clostridium aceticum]KJF27589.1 hypothetical protein TZ02_07345 [Clostridium aceticum]